MSICEPEKKPLLPPRCRADSNAPSISNWVRGNKRDDAPFIDYRNCYLCVVVDVAYVDVNNLEIGVQRHESLGSDDVRNNRTNSYITYGVDKLIRFYNKSLTTEERDALILKAQRIFYNSPAGLQYFIPIRPKSKVKVLVRIPVNSFKEDYPELPYTIPNYPADRFLSARFDVRLFKRKIQYVANIISNYYGRTKRGEPLSSTRNLDISLEARKLISFISIVQKFINYNELELDLGGVLNTREEYIEFVIDSTDFRLVDVLYTNQASEQRSLRIGLPMMDMRPPTPYSQTGISTIRREIRNPPLISQSTMALVYWTQQELFEMFNNQIKPAWSYFVEKYLYRETPIETDMAIFESAMDDFTNSKFYSDVERGIDTAARVTGYINLANDIYSGNESLIELLDEEYIKTWDEKKQQDDEILNQIFVNDVVNMRPVFNITDPSGPTLNAAQIEETVGGMFLGAYERVLNHVDVTYILSKIALCSGLDSELIDRRWYELLFNLLGFLKQLPDFLLVTFDFDLSKEALLAFILDISEQLVNYIFNFIFNLLNIFLTELVTSMLEALDELCKEDYNFGSVNLESLLSNNFNSLEEAAGFYGTLSTSLGDGTDSGALLRELLRDISSVLSMAEMCSLMNGQASASVVAIVHNMILLEKYSSFHNSFRTESDVIRFFASIGTLLDQSICDMDVPITNTSACESGFAANIRNQLLRGKEGITSRQIEDQIAAERERRKELIEEFASIFDSNEKSFSDKFNEMLRNTGVIPESIANHASTENSFDMMVQSLFINPATRLVQEGLGELETPYNIIEFEQADSTFGFQEFLFGPDAPGFRTGAGRTLRSPPGYTPELYTLEGTVEISLGEILDSITTPTARGQELFGNNRGVMHIVSNPQQRNLLQNTKRLYNVGSPESEIPRLLSRINLNPDSQPTNAESLSVTAVQPDDLRRNWSYNTSLFRPVGNYSFVDRLDDPEIVDEVNKKISYIIESRESEVPFVNTIPDWWGSVDIDLPLIKGSFIKRTPLVGFPQRYKREQLGGAELASPILRSYEENEKKAIQAEFNRSPFLGQSGDYYINVFNDVPQAIQRDIIPSDYDSPITSQYMRQKATYTNFLIESLSLINADTTDAIFTDRDKIHELASSYQNTFNDVMRTLYKFVSDSPFYDKGVPPAGSRRTTEDLTEALGEQFRDNDRIIKLLGVDGVKDVFKENLLSAMASDEQPSPSSLSDIPKEAALRFMIRIYIFEFLCKNLYTLTSIPEKFNVTHGKIFDPAPSTFITVWDINIETPGIGRGFKRMLDLEDIVDPILVSYIFEYISFSAERSEVECQSFYELAKKLADKELQEENPESGFLSQSGPGDTLAYYPSRIGENDRRSALRYYIAKELKTALPELTKLIYKLFYEHLNFPEIAEDAMPRRANRRVLNLAFLDKLQTVGYNVNGAQGIRGNDDLSPTPNYERWMEYGEGLYMEFYIRPAGVGPSRPSDRAYWYENLIFMDKLGPDDSMEIFNSDRVGLRLCVRDSTTHRDGREIFNSVTERFTEDAELSDFLSSESIIDRENGKGFPLLTYEVPWGEIKDQITNKFGTPALRPYGDSETQRNVMDLMKERLTQLDGFETLFGYVFPIRKLFNFLLIINEQNMSAFMTNYAALGTGIPGRSVSGAGPEGNVPSVEFGLTHSRDTSIPGIGENQRKGLLPASVIDPEQFMTAKAIAKSIIENLNNSDNYTYVNSEVEEEGGIGNLAMKRTLEGI